MSDGQIRLLFIPVSGPRGMGEYARATAIATAALQRWPQAEIRFALSRGAAYAAETPFQATFLPSSPTFHSREVAALIREFKPSLVLFDNAGRTSQLRAAVAGGARTVFISSRPKQRRRAFRLRWMRLLDEHWIAYPQFIAGAPGRIERLKLALLGRPTLRFLDAVLPQEDPELAHSVMARFGVRAGEYVLVVPGGGTGHPGALAAPQVVAEAARRIALHSYPTILVAVTPQGPRRAAQAGDLKLAQRLPIAMVSELIRGARLVISNGGDTMLQALACNRPCVAVPIAGDQAHRIKRCVRAGLVASARLDAADLERVALRMLETGDASESVGARAARAGAPEVTNGIETALAAIGELAHIDALEAQFAAHPERLVAQTPAVSRAPLQLSAAAAPRFLFLPVSGPHGMGEYARAVQIAQAVAARWPSAKIHFALSREAPYETDAAFSYTFLPSSPTFHTPEVIALIAETRPDVVIFDNAGRTAQLRAAQRIGARVIYVSARARQRRKAFRLRWMSLIDEHWLAYPQLLTGPLSAVESFKLRWMGRPLVRHLDVMLPAPAPRAAASLLQRLALTTKPYVLVVPGGGTGHPGARDAVEVFAAAAHALAERGITTVLVAPANGADVTAPATLYTLPRLPLSELAALMRRARLVIVNGGSTLLQAIASHAPCVAVSIAKDQAKRVRQCSEAGLALAATLNAVNIVNVATALLEDEPARAALAQRAANLQLADGLGIALGAIEGLLSRSGAR
jgi:spore coat polysaccharide biosynthesis predicted glycosyltransferase SpsG